jgi:hypothetical protein
MAAQKTGFLKRTGLSWVVISFSGWETEKFIWASCAASGVKTWPHRNDWKVLEAINQKSVQMRPRNVLTPMRPMIYFGTDSRFQSVH